MFRALRGLSQLKNGEIAARGGVTRGYIESKSCGATAIDLEDIEILARAFAVDEHVFLMDPMSAQRWVLDNTPSEAAGGSAQGKPGSACTATLTRRSELSSRTGSDGVVLPFRKSLVA